MTKRKHVDEGKEKRKHKKEDVSSKKMTEHETEFLIARSSESDRRANVLSKKAAEQSDRSANVLSKKAAEQSDRSANVLSKKADVLSDRSANVLSKKADVQSDRSANVLSKKAAVQSDRSANVLSKKADVQSDRSANVLSKKAAVQSDRSANVLSKKADVQSDRSANVLSKKADVQSDRSANVLSKKADVQVDACSMQRSDASGYNNKEEDKFMLLLHELASNHFILGKKNVKLNDVRKQMRRDDTVRPREVKMSNDVWRLRNNIREYIQKLGTKKTFYASNKDDLEMIFLYLERKNVKIASDLTDRKLTDLKRYARDKNINLID